MRNTSCFMSYETQTNDIDRFARHKGTLRSQYHAAYDYKKQYKPYNSAIIACVYRRGSSVTVHEGILFIARKSYERFFQVLRK